MGRKAARRTAARSRPLPLSVEASLVGGARAALRHAYAPKSGVCVGAALLMERGRIFRGANIELGMNELGVCAERAALYKAVTEGFRSVRAVAVAVRGDVPTTPCGLCREALHKLAVSREIPVFVVARRGKARRFTLGELLPHRCGGGR